MSTTTVKLSRGDPSQPWGFRIHGGVDFNQPLVILKVTAGSLSAQQGLEPGDQIIQINGKDSLRLRHREAQQLILDSGKEVVFEVLRGDQANLQRALNNEAPITLQSLKQSSSSKTSTNVLQTMVSSTSTVTTAAVTPGWNGPKFTEESIKETMTNQAQVLDTGAIGVNFIKANDKELDLEKSEVLKMLKQIENEKKGLIDRARSPSVQPPPVAGAPIEQTLPPTFNSNVSSTFGIYMNRHYEAQLQAQQPHAPWATKQPLSPSIPLQQPPPTAPASAPAPQQQPEPETVAASVEG